MLLKLKSKPPFDVSRGYKCQSYSVSLAHKTYPRALITEMASVDELFGQIQSKLKAEKQGRGSYIVLKNVENPNFNVKLAFPDSIHSRKVSPAAPSAGIEYIVNFKNPAAAEEAASNTELPGVTIFYPRGKKRTEKKKKEKPTSKHAWKLSKDIKILIRRHVKSLEEKKVSVEWNVQETATYVREISFLKSALRYLHSGSDILSEQTEYFDNYDQDAEVLFIKKARVSLEIQIQERVTEMRTRLQQNKKADAKQQIAMKKLKKSYYCSEKLLQYLRGQRTPKVKQEVLDLTEIKEEPVSEEDEVEETPVDNPSTRTSKRVRMG